MSLSIANEKVRVATEDGATWYEFGLETISGRVYHGELVEVADPGGSDGAIVLSYGAERFRTYAVAHGGRGFLHTNQVATELAVNGPVSLRVDGDGEALILALVEGADGRKYLKYRSGYVAGLLRKNLGASFRSKTFGATFR